MIKKYSIVQDSTDSIYAVFSDSIVLSHIVRIVEDENNNLVEHWEQVKVLEEIKVDFEVVSFEEGDCTFKILIRNPNVLVDNLWDKTLTQCLSVEACYAWFIYNINEVLDELGVMEN
jgi:hypothetical protein